ncbi:LIM domain-containing protein [Planktothrix agardhii]|jgi:cysteine/glycine-rich protein|uniref:LIM domain-containing protein n=1 Tax=Planktothrix agardhii TaxID=1160 RepID=UPI0020A7782C|nr:LIM domain-containing protein [Planktothrix agardhii]
MSSFVIAFNTSAFLVILLRRQNKLLTITKKEGYMPKWGGGKPCGRCGKSVYSNEEIIAAGGSWHKRGCFTCKECNKSLDANTVAEKMSEDGGCGEIYCRSCYGKSYGTEGYGYGGGAGALTGK